MDLNSANVGAVLTGNVRLFHSLGPATAKARSSLCCRRARDCRQEKMTILGSTVSDLEGLLITIKSERYLEAKLLRAL